MTTAIISTTTPPVMGAASDEVHALAEEIHREEGLAPIDALCKALAMHTELAQFATRWNADARRAGNPNV